jgi:pyroglutamyl-peptidase
VLCKDAGTGYDCRPGGPPNRRIAATFSPPTDMPRVLITAFEPYDRWKANASWLALVELTYNLPTEPAVTTRLYPVDFAQVQARLAKDLEANYDYALHLGQAPGATRIQLEAVALNIGGGGSQSPDEYRELIAGGPVAYRSPLPLGSWASMLRQAGIPAETSYHAGTYLCNAALYFSCYLAEQMALRTRSALIHLPLDVRQTATQDQHLAALPASLSAAGLRMILDDLARGI